jgi:hypothetical protein
MDSPPSALTAIGNHDIGAYRKEQDRQARASTDCDLFCLMNRTPSNASIYDGAGCFVSRKNQSELLSETLAFALNCCGNLSCCNFAK